MTSSLIVMLFHSILVSLFIAYARMGGAEVKGQSWALLSTYSRKADRKCQPGKLMLERLKISMLSWWPWRINCVPLPPVIPSKVQWVHATTLNSWTTCVRSRDCLSMGTPYWWTSSYAYRYFIFRWNVTRVRRSRFNITGEQLQYLAWPPCLSLGVT